MSSVPIGASPLAGAPKKKYTRAVGPRLRILLLAVFALVALLGANSIYLASITALESWTGKTYQDYFYQWMFLVHLLLGLALIVPFLTFGIIHLLNSRNRRNKRAIRVGYALFGVSVLALASGLLLMRIEGLLDLKEPLKRGTIYWLHVSCPLVAAWLYWLHRLAGPRIKWRIGASYAAIVVVVVAGMVFFQAQDPRRWNVAGNPLGEKYFHPSEAITSTGDFIPPDVMMMDDYCQKCHKDIHADWSHSAHRFSSFNNPAYLKAIRETREVALKRDGDVQASRWCAGCHDPVPFLSGQFNRKDYDLVNDPTAQAGITCTSCHAIVNVNSTIGNGDYTIEEPIHYPFATSTNPVLRFINEQLVKAKPAFHKKTFLKPLHKTAEFCSTCHKVGLPFELNKYKEFVRGQNHYDTYLLSGVGHGARSFYYPEKAVANCAGCHMKPLASNDFGAKDFEGIGELQRHRHGFESANTALARLKQFEDADQVIATHQSFLKEIVRVDIFGLKENADIGEPLIGPLRPLTPALKPGTNYLLETVIRTLKIGHPLTQGTVDSNELWMEIEVKSGDRVIGRSGALDAEREVDPWSHFVNVFMLDRHGNRIDRRNPQDIFVPLYNHQIPPGAGQVVHYELAIPPDVQEPITIQAKLNYRKFDKRFMDFVTNEWKPGDPPIGGHEPGKKYLNDLPITVLASDSMTFPLEGGSATVENPPSKIPVWQRWNDYGIGLFLEGGVGKAKGELKQAEQAFAEVEKLGRFDGPLNLARVYQQEGRLDEAVAAIGRAVREHGKSKDDPPAPPWTASWLSGVINRQQGNLEEAEANFRSVLESHTREMIDRGFDFSLDYEVINELGQTLYDLASKSALRENSEGEAEYQRQAIAWFEKTLSIDSENVTAHKVLSLLHRQLGNEEKAAFHEEAHLRYKPDDNAVQLAVKAAREKYPAADKASEALVIYPLTRPGAPGLPAVSAMNKSGQEIRSAAQSGGGR